VTEVADAKEAATTPADLKSAEEAFVTSSVCEVLAVSRIEEHDLPAGGPITKATAGKVRASRRSSRAADALTDWRRARVSRFRVRRGPVQSRA
jgi:hypothetical protein